MQGIELIHFKDLNQEDLLLAAERFHAKVEKSSGCWTWKAAIKDNGYGYFRISKSLGMVSAHKAAWILSNGAIPTGMYVCHRCDNRACCNPAHLWLGTAKDNQRDMAKKGRVYSYCKGKPDIARDADGRFKGN